MALVVEDGSGMANAEAYCSVAFFLAYHAARLNTGAAAMTTPEIEAALRRSTDYLLQKYRSKWAGCRQVSDQSLDWPRSGIIVDQYIIVDFDIVPIDVKNACAELALKSFSETLLPDAEQQVLRESIGPLSFEYDKTSPQSKRYKSIEALLSPYLSSACAGPNVQLMRA